MINDTQDFEFILSVDEITDDIDDDILEVILEENYVGSNRFA